MEIAHCKGFLCRGHDLISVSAFIVAKTAYLVALQQTAARVLANKMLSGPCSQREENAVFSVCNYAKWQNFKWHSIFTRNEICRAVYGACTRAGTPEPRQCACFARQTRNSYGEAKFHYFGASERAVCTVCATGNLAWKRRKFSPEMPRISAVFFTFE